MSSEMITAIIASVVTLIAALGVFMGKSGLQRVVSGGTEREATAVGQMATLLGSLSGAQIDREKELLQTVRLALTTVAEMTKTVTEVAAGIETHQITSSSWNVGIQGKQDAMMRQLEKAIEAIDELGKLQVDIGIEVLKCTRGFKETAEEMAAAQGHGVLNHKIEKRKAANADATN